MTLLQALWRRLVQFGFRLLYNELAFTYDWVSHFVSLGQWKCWQRTAFDFIGDDRGQVILELAHGTGDLQRDLNEQGFKSLGVDLSPQMGSIAQRKLKRSGIEPRLARCRAQALPCTDGQFDVILCTFPAPFIFEAETLKELRRVLRTPGRVVIVLNGLFTTSGLHVKLLQWLYRITGQQSGEKERKNMYQSLLDHVATFGFAPKVQRVSCDYSEAYLIVMDVTETVKADKFIDN